MDKHISTTAEAVEADALPRRHDVHADPATAPQPVDLPEGMCRSIASKSPAQWAHERLILYIQNFEAQLDGEHEVAIGFAGGELGILRIEGLGFFDPDIVTFYGRDADGSRTQLIQHVSQLNVMLKAWPKDDNAEAPKRIGFRLAADLEVAERAQQTAPD